MLRPKAAARSQASTTSSTADRSDASARPVDSLLASGCVTSAGSADAAWKRVGGNPREFESRILRLAEQALSRVALTRAALDVFVATDTPSKAQPTWYAGPPRPP